MKTGMGLAALVAGGWLMYAVITGQNILPSWFTNVLKASGQSGQVGPGLSGKSSSSPAPTSGPR